MKNLINALFFLVLVLSAQNLYAQFSGGGSSADDPYIIANATDLIFLASNVNTGNSGAGVSYAGNYFKQTNDISLTKGWTAIGTEATPYSGNYDGNGHKINGIIITTPLAAYQGLFGYIFKRDIIKNLAVEGLLINIRRKQYSELV